MVSSIEQFNPRLFILAGIPGCGKTTWARTFFSTIRIISSDKIREEKWLGEPYDKDRNAEVFNVFHHRLGKMLAKGEDAVADATSLGSQARLKLVELADYYYADKHLIFFNNIEQALHRNYQRTGAARVPPEAQTVMLAKFKESRSAILGEHYTSTTIIERVI